MYVAMEFVTGVGLDTIINSARCVRGFDAKLFYTLINSMCGILQDLQWMGVIHGDIAPSNIIRHCASNFKLIDFNFADSLPGTRNRHRFTTHTMAAENPKR
ncbi:MAG: protein kinase domain-containing protein [Methylococcales bacterium]